MGKHDQSKRQKEARNAEYAKRYRQKECKQCGHRSCRTGRCRICGGEMKRRRG